MNLAHWVWLAIVVENPAYPLEISDRHCRRLLERYREHGPLSLVNRRRGQPGNRQLMPGLAERALRTIREHYADFGPTVRQLMTQAGLWLPRKSRPPRVHQPRPRRACTGELIQIDGCEYRWSSIVVRPARCSFTLMMRPAG